MDPANAVEQNLNGTTVQVHAKSELLNWPAKSQYRNPGESIEATLSESETAEDLSNWISLGTSKFRSQVSNIVADAITDGWIAVVTESQGEWSTPSVTVRLLAPGGTVLAMASEIVSRPDWQGAPSPVIGFEFEWTAESNSSDRMLWNRRTVSRLRLAVNSAKENTSGVASLGVMENQLGDWKGNHREAGWRTEVKPEVLRHRPAAALELVVRKAEEQDTLTSERDNYDPDAPARKALREQLEWTQKSAKHDAEVERDRAKADIDRALEGYDRDPSNHIRRARKAQQIVKAVDQVFAVEGETQGGVDFVTLEKAVLQCAKGLTTREPEVAATLFSLLKLEVASLS